MEGEETKVTVKDEKKEKRGLRSNGSKRSIKKTSDHGSPTSRRI